MIVYLLLLLNPRGATVLGFNRSLTLTVRGGGGFTDSEEEDAVNDDDDDEALLFLGDFFVEVMDKVSGLVVNLRGDVVFAAVEEIVFGKAFDNFDIEFNGEALLLFF